MSFRVLACAALLCAPSAAFAANSCAALKDFKFPQATITEAATEPAGAPGLPRSPQTAKLPAFCRVQGVLRPSADSAIRFEVWLPEQGWNSRLLNVGNGGFAGSIYYSQMVANVQHGYATAGSDAGHQGDAEDASWAFGHPEKIADFGYRAVHLTALLSKAMVQAFYGAKQRAAYFDACSDGGREALMEAQRFPEDYDGILAGAPANNWTRMLSGGLALLQSSMVDPRSYISSTKLPAIKQAALAACDAQDGLTEGVISNPEACHFDPAVLACHGEENASCLTPPQVTALRTIYTGGKDSNGARLFPGLLPGDEDPSWRDWVIGQAPGAASGAAYMSGYFRYMVLNDPTWNPLTARVDDMRQKAIDRTAKDVDATDPNLAPFAAHGGKLILYHGWNDPAISPWNTVEYFKAVQGAMGTEKAAGAVRLYMVPGMEHCAGGPGPNTFGQLSMPGGAGEGTGALDALQAWVEDGKAPGAIPASKAPARPGADGRGVTGGAPPPSIVRPLCPYPQLAKYDGSGAPDRAESFSCVAP